MTSPLRNRDELHWTGPLLPLMCCALFIAILPQCDGTTYTPFTIERPVAVIADLGENDAIDAGTSITIDGSGSHLGAGTEGQIGRAHV